MIFPKLRIQAELPHASWSNPESVRRLARAMAENMLGELERELDKDVVAGRPLAFDRIENLKIFAKVKLSGAQELLAKYAQIPVAPKPSPGNPNPDFRIFKLISRLRKMGASLLLEGDRLVYFAPTGNARVRSILAELYERREEVKKYVTKRVQQIEPGKYEEYKAKICQRISPATLSPLDEFKDCRATLQNGLRRKSG